jgi:hypothetical protein
VNKTVKVDLEKVEREINAEKHRNIPALLDYWGKGLCFIVIFAILCMMGYFGLETIIEMHPPSAPSRQVEYQVAHPPVMMREDFRFRVDWVYRTRQKVIDEIGRPDYTQDLGGYEYWYYNRRTKDPNTGKVDDFVQVGFDGDRVRSVSFF